MADLLISLNLGLVACYVKCNITARFIGQRLPAADRRVDVGRVELQPIAAPAGALGGDQGRAAAEKGVQHNLVPGEQSSIASATIAAGFTVGCNASRLPSSPQREKELAPG